MADLENTNSLEDLFHLMEEWTKNKYKIGFFNELLQPNHDEKNAVAISEDLLSEDIPSGLSDLAFAIIMKLKDANTLFDEYQEELETDSRPLVDLAAVERIEKQLKDHSVYVCFLGRYNSGKTTLINAMLGIEVLPVSDTPETAITLLIQDDDKSFQPSSVRLIHDGRLEASGVERVRNTLESLHSGIRGRSRMSVEEYLMKVHFPSIKSSSESEQPKAFIVDTPGSNEVGQVNLQKIADLNLKTASAYIYVMTYSDIKNKEDYEALKIIHKRDEEIFLSERLTIVVTHFDKFYESSRKSAISREQIKSIVAQTIKSEIGVEVSQDIVFPLSGVWACKSRVCGRSVYNCDYNDVEMASLSILRVENPGKNTRQYLDKIEEMGKQKLVEKLEAVSGILEFEKRIQEVNQRLIEIWKKNLVVGCTEFLESAITEMKHMEESLFHRIKDWESRVNSAVRVVQYHKAMLDSIGRNSAFYEVLQDAFNKDMNYDQKIERSLEQLMNEINQQKAKKNKYGIEDLQREVDAFSVNAEQNLKSFIYQRKFVSCQRLLRQHTQRISEKFGRLRSAAILVIDPDVAPTTIQRFLNEDDLSGDDDQLSQDNEIFDMDIGAIKISDIVKPTFSQKLQQWIPFKRVEIINDDHIHRVLTDRGENLRQLHRQFVNQIRDRVLLYFFKAYCSIVTGELDIFTHQQESADLEPPVHDLRDKKKHLQSKKRQKDDLHRLIEHFERLKKLLSQAN